MLKVIVGLGNPGQQYARTRHNAGFWFVDELALRFTQAWQNEKKFKAQIAQIICAGQKVILVKPDTFMNLSGLSVAELVNYYQLKPESILVVHDELDLLPGQGRLKVGGGHAGHNGLRDIIAKLGENGFNRLRLGIGRPQGKMAVADYVLSAPTLDEHVDIENALQNSMRYIDELVLGHMDVVMRNLHIKKC